MKGSELIQCTRAGFLLLVLFQMSLFLCASAQTNSTNSTDSPVTMAPNMTTNVTQSSNSTMAPANNTTGTNGTRSETVFCQVASCNYSTCYSTLTSTNVTSCSASENNCELRRDGDLLYSVRCTNTCLSSCTNTSQNNCSINCCSNTSCVNSTLNSLLNSPLIITTTTPATTTTSTTTAKSSVATTTMATNGKKCHKLSCTGDNCFQGNTNVALCSPGQNFCMLKKTMAATVTTWTAVCIEDCSKETVCTSASSTCILECCNANTTASCLKLNGQVNIPGSGTIAPSSHIPLVVSSFFLWLLMMWKSAD